MPLKVFAVHCIRSSKCCSSAVHSNGISTCNVTKWEPNIAEVEPQACTPCSDNLSVVLCCVPGATWIAVVPRSVCTSNFAPKMASVYAIGTVEYTSQPCLVKESSGCICKTHSDVTAAGRSDRLSSHMQGIEASQQHLPQSVR